MNQNPESKRIHFVGDVRDLGAGYQCQRCGYATAFKVEMHDHRRGLISQCDRARFVDWLRSRVHKGQR